MGLTISRNRFFRDFGFGLTISRNRTISQSRYRFREFVRFRELGFTYTGTLQVLVQYKYSYIRLQVGVPVLEYSTYLYTIHIHRIPYGNSYTLRTVFYYYCCILAAFLCGCLAQGQESAHLPLVVAPPKDSPQEQQQHQPKHGPLPAAVAGAEKARAGERGGRGRVRSRCRNTMLPQK